MRKFFYKSYGLMGTTHFRLTGLLIYIYIERERERESHVHYTWEDCFLVVFVAFVDKSFLFMRKKQVHT